MAPGPVALSLPEEVRVALAEQLLESLDSADQREIDARWAKEAEDRIDAYDRGEVAAFPTDEVFFLAAVAPQEMIHRFLAPARAELEEAVDYYEGCRPGLGDEFAAEVQKAKTVKDLAKAIASRRRRDPKSPPVRASRPTL